MSKDFNLKEIYKNNFFPAPEKLFQLVKKDNPDVKRKDIQDFVNNVEAEQLTKERKERKKQGHIISLLPNELWQMDIYVLDRYSKKNKGYAYILAVVDVFTRKAYAEPMKNKDIKTVCETFQKIINESGFKTRSIICDNDGAF